LLLLLRVVFVPTALFVVGHRLQLPIGLLVAELPPAFSAGAELAWMGFSYYMGLCSVVFCRLLFAARRGHLGLLRIFGYELCAGLLSIHAYLLGLVVAAILPARVFRYCWFFAIEVG